MGDLREQLAEYERLRAGQVKSLALDEVLSQLPATLVRARIARGWTQRDLAERVGHIGAASSEGRGGRLRARQSRKAGSHRRSSGRLAERARQTDALRQRAQSAPRQTRRFDPNETRRHIALNPTSPCLPQPKPTTLRLARSSRPVKQPHPNPNARAKLPRRAKRSPRRQLKRRLNRAPNAPERRRPKSRRRRSNNRKVAPEAWRFRRFQARLSRPRRSSMAWSKPRIIWCRLRRKWTP